MKAPVPSWSASALAIAIITENLAFDLAEYAVRANTPFRIVFDQRDAKIPTGSRYEAGPEGPSRSAGRSSISASSTSSMPPSPSRRSQASVPTAAPFGRT